MPDLTIKLKRHPDHTASLTCIRRDGTTTWQRQRGSLGAVFPPHDLTHYAVEQALGIRHGFYGLIADGWNIEDFAKPWPKGTIPDEAQEVELIVGFFDMERTNMECLTSAQYREHIETYLASRAQKKRDALASARLLDDEELPRVRAFRNELLERWWNVLPGEVLELAFDRPAA